MILGCVTGGARGPAIPAPALSCARSVSAVVCFVPFSWCSAVRVPLSRSRSSWAFATRLRVIVCKRAHPAPGRFMARRRRPKAVRVRGGMWMRPPRPKPRPEPPEMLSSDTSCDDEGYESCGHLESEVLIDALIAAVQPTIQMLFQQGELDAAENVQALCDCLHTRQQDHARLHRAHTRLRSTLSDAKKQITGKENLNGQVMRYWRRIQSLQRQLFLERVKARSRRQWYPP